MTFFNSFVGQSSQNLFLIFSFRRLGQHWSFSYDCIQVFVTCSFKNTFSTWFIWSHSFKSNNFSACELWCINMLYTYTGPVIGIGLGAGKFLGVGRIFARISPNLPKNFCSTFAYTFSPTKIVKAFFGVTSKWRYSCVFLHTLGATVLNKKFREPFFPYFQGFCPDFHGCCLDFQNFCPDFQGFSQIFDKSKFWGCVCTPCIPALYTIGWVSSQTLGPPMDNMLHLIHNIYINKKVDLFWPMLMIIKSANDIYWKWNWTNYD